MIVGIDDVATFKAFFDVVYEETDSVELACNSVGMKVSVLDRSHTCFYEVFYDGSFFDLYDVDGAEVVVLDIDDFVKVLKNSHKDDYLTLSSDADRVVAKFEHDGSRRVFEMVQVSDFMESPVPPELNSQCTVHLNVDDLIQSLKDLDVFKCGSCHIVCNDEFTIASKPDASMKYNQVLDCDKDGNGDAYYTTDYLKQITRFKKIDKTVTLAFGDTMPLTWIVQNDDVTVKGLIAPRIEEE